MWFLIIYFVIGQYHLCIFGGEVEPYSPFHNQIQSLCQSKKWKNFRSPKLNNRTEWILEKKAKKKKIVWYTGISNPVIISSQRGKPVVITDIFDN